MTLAITTMLDTNPLAPSAMLTAFKNHTQNTTQSIKAIAGTASNESMTGIPMAEGTRVGNSHRTKVKMEVLAANLTLGERLSLRISLN
jgi:hypothetical protein